MTPWKFGVDGKQVLLKGEQGLEVNEHIEAAIEMAAKETRRRFTVEYKQPILHEADA